MSILTKEGIQKIFNDDWLLMDDCEGLENCTVIKELARMALAAMDSETVEMPLDYLQGHKDGLEWAARLAEANHPDTGDWLYDDPIELAKAIRKGPDMPPVQPVADSEPDRNPVLAYADSYRDMAKQGVESVPIWSVITDLERNIAPLYRHAQPAPVVPEEKPIPNTLSMYAVDAVAAIAEVKGWNACRAAMLEADPQLPGSDSAPVPGSWIPVSERMPEAEGHYLVWANASRIDGYCDHLAMATYQGGEWSNEFNWLVTHWMPLPAAPQEAINALIPLVSRNEREVK
ncbi:DUF551 domain-containing protein [Klebsiella quasipneumoniae subsp. quasipneumoniae]|nr:DUF551 domain-containing protein [Klebsiella quasipneumoniae]ROC62997.1 DUF551 domain-containing protein [Klebsiella quasipneumoniae subsp. quasipneumoniae]